MHGGGEQRDVRLRDSGTRLIQRGTMWYQKCRHEYDAMMWIHY